MKLVPQAIPGIYEVSLTMHTDARGAFARTFCADIFGAAGLTTHWVQTNMSQTLERGTVRGLHFQRRPHAEAKLVRATRGQIFDVALDLRTDSPTYGRHCAVTLSADIGNALYIPEGFAHGFQALTDEVTLLYYHSAPYVPESEGGVLPVDPDLAIAWPLTVTQVSLRDRALPPLSETASI